MLIIAYNTKIIATTCVKYNSLFSNLISFPVHLNAFLYVWPSVDFSFCLQLKEQSWLISSDILWLQSCCNTFLYSVLFLNLNSLVTSPHQPVSWATLLRWEPPPSCCVPKLILASEDSKHHQAAARTTVRFSWTVLSALPQSYLLLTQLLPLACTECDCSTAKSSGNSSTGSHPVIVKSSFASAQKYTQYHCTRILLQNIVYGLKKGVYSPNY